MITVGQLDSFERKLELAKSFSLQRKLASLSIRNPDKRFVDLYNLTYWEPMVRTALLTVRSRSGAKTAGTDGRTKYNVNDDKLMVEICQGLKSKTITPGQMRHIEIPKANGGTRTISIATYRDRAILTIIKLILEPIFEPHFDPSSHGFRPNRSAHDAIAEMRLYIGERRRYSWVIETDVQSCFSSIHQGYLMQILEERIADGDLLQLIRKYLRAGAALCGFPDNPEEEGDTGCPQGSPLSPLMCNIYLDKLDKFVNQALHREQKILERGKNLSPETANITRRRHYLGSKLRLKRKGPFHLIRYADDLVILSPACREEVENYLLKVQEFTHKRLRLRFAPEKTRISHVSDGFCFLGFHIKRIFRPDLKKRTAIVNVDPKRKERHREKLRKLLSSGHDREVANVITAVNQRIRGWRNYYQKSLTNCEFLAYIDLLAFWLLLKWLMKKHDAGKKKTFKTFYKRVVTKDGHNFKTIAWMDVFLTKAVWAIPKHTFDYTFKSKHPWQGKNTCREM